MTANWDAEFESLVRDALPLLPAEAPLEPELSTVEAGLDSLGIVRLLTSLEEKYDISVPGEMVHSDMFSTPAALWRTVAALREAKSEV
jgi:acyl carrier protein